MSIWHVMSGLRAHDLSGKLRPFGRCPGRAGRKPDRVFGTLKFTDVLGRWNAAELLAVGETDLSPLVSALRGRRRGRPAGPSDRQGVRSASLANASLAKTTAYRSSIANYRFRRVRCTRRRVRRSTDRSAPVLAIS